VKQTNDGTLASFGDERLPDRFWDKVSPEPNTDCWLWTASTTNGYGDFHLDRKIRRAHRVSFVALVGEVPTGLVLDHVAKRGCCGPSCVNPHHLQPVTQRENLLRGRGFAARQARQTHCKNGHPLGDDRRCRICARDRQRAYRLRQAASR